MPSASVVQRGWQIATLEDCELAVLLKRQVEQEAVRVLTETRLERFELEIGAPCGVGGRRIAGNPLLLGLGCVAVVADLGIDAVGVEACSTIDGDLRTNCAVRASARDTIGGLMLTSSRLRSRSRTSAMALTTGATSGDGERDL